MNPEPNYNQLEGGISSSAIVYIIVNRSGRSIETSDEGDNKDHELITAIKSELKKGDNCTIAKAGNIVARLNTTTEIDAMKFARVARNTFQRIEYSGREDSISIGILLYQRHEDECLHKVLRIAYELGKKASKKTGNTIECLDLVQ